MMRTCWQFVIGLFFWLFISANSYAIYPPPVQAHRGMVVSAHYLASEVGLDILKQGGNAVDAAVAVGYALAVVYPTAGNLGGGGFMTLHLANGKDVFLNFREKAPLAAYKDMFLDSHHNVIPNLSYLGYLAVGVPGTVMGLNTALQKYGTMSLAHVMAPAIKLAEKGFILSPFDASTLKFAYQDFIKQPNVASIFLKHGNMPYQAGDRLVQTDLATTLKLIAHDGADAFYKGPIADKLVAASKQHQGILSKQDFLHYSIEELTPLRCHYRGFTIISAPPPSSGGTTLCEMLNILTGYPLVASQYHSANNIHYLVEAMRYAYYDRNHKLGDPHFVNNPVQTLISQQYAAAIRQHIRPNQATPASELPSAMIHEGSNTTHYSIVDGLGNAVALTYTLNNTFGARVIAGDTGFFLNDEMDDFTIKESEPNLFGLIQGVKNEIQPGKRPLSSMTPTILTKQGKIYLVLGSPGGSIIITAVLQTLLNVINYNMDIKAAVDSPRIHFQWFPELIWYEPFALSKDTRERLRDMGYNLITIPHHHQGDVQAILINPHNHTLYGASDDRVPTGKAVGF